MSDVTIKHVTCSINGLFITVVILFLLSCYYEDLTHESNSSLLLLNLQPCLLILFHS